MIPIFQFFTSLFVVQEYVLNSEKRRCVLREPGLLACLFKAFLSQRHCMEVFAMFSFETMNNLVEVSLWLL